MEWGRSMAVGWGGKVDKRRQKGKERKFGRDDWWRGWMGMLCKVETHGDHYHTKDIAC